MNTTSEYSFAGFFSTTVVTGIHLQDVVMAVSLGFFGALGGYLFKCGKDWLEKKKK